MPRVCLSFPEDELQDSSMSLIDSFLTVHEIQKALFDKIENHQGGKKGVWEAISPRFKFEAGEHSGRHKDETKI